MNYQVALNRNAWTEITYAIQDSSATANQHKLGQSIFIPSKIKRHILSYIYCWRSKNT